MSQEAQTKILELFQSFYGAAPQCVETLGGHASKRQMLRLKRDSTSQAVIGVFNPDQAENKAFLGFSRHFFSAGLPVPEIYCEAQDASTYIEQDLGSLTLLDAMNQPSRDLKERDDRALKYYRRVIEKLPLFQIKVGASLNYELCYQGKVFDAQAMHSDLALFQSAFLKLKLPSFHDDSLREEFEQFVGLLSTEPTDHFMYRDLQARNIMLLNDAPFFIDYQSGRKGPLHYDLASLLYQSRANLSEKVREELTDYYILQVQKLIKLDAKSFKQKLPAFVVLRVIQALGAYGRAGLIDGKEYFVRSIPFALKTLREALEHPYNRGKLKVLRDALEKIKE